jgi:hypothetical protein
MATCTAPEYLTEDQAREYLTVTRGYPAAEAERVLDEARRFPSRYAYTDDRYAWAVYQPPCAQHDLPWRWMAGDSTETEKRIKALATARTNGWRLVR